jgi:hypothetical protein
MAIGRDHIASTVHTIVFAYAGAALPLLLLFEIYHQPATTVASRSRTGSAAHLEPVDDHGGDQRRTSGAPPRPG